MLGCNCTADESEQRACIHAVICACARVFTRSYAHVCVRACMHAVICVYVHAVVCSCVWVFVNSGEKQVDILDVYSVILSDNKTSYHRHTMPHMLYCVVGNH